MSTGEADQLERPPGRSSATRERIIRIAAELFARNGFDATGVAELGQAVNLGRGALYHHIESKEALLYAICLRAFGDVAEHAEQVAGSSLNPDMKLRRLSRQLMRTVSERLPEVTVLLRDAGALTDEPREVVDGLRARYEGVWGDILTAAAKSGEMRPSHRVLVKGIFGMHAFAYNWIASEQELEPEEIADVFCDTLLHGLLVPHRRY